MDGLVALVQTALTENPFSGHIFIIRGRLGDLIKVLWWRDNELFLGRLDVGVQAAQERKVGLDGLLLV